MKRSTVIVSIIILLVIASLGAILFLYFAKPVTKAVSEGEVIALIPLNGAISEEASASSLTSSASITPDFVRKQIKRAEEDPSVKAIIFKINSPGGSVGASQEIAYYIRKAKLPIVMFAGDTVASGGYYIASQADKIVCKPGSLVGSIGVISQFPDLTGLYEKLGIKMQTIKSGRNKDMFTRELTEEEKRKFQILSDELYMQFIEDVAKGRNLSSKKVREIATGELFAATQAKRLGLVDEIGDYDKAVDVAAKLANIKKPRVEEYEPPTIFEELFGASYYRLSMVITLIKAQILGRDLTLLEQIKSSYGIPQYRYNGGN